MLYKVLQMMAISVEDIRNVVNFTDDTNLY